MDGWMETQLHTVMGLTDLGERDKLSACEEVSLSLGRRTAIGDYVSIIYGRQESPIAGGVLRLVQIGLASRGPSDPSPVSARATAEDRRFAFLRSRDECH